MSERCRVAEEHVASMRADHHALQCRCAALMDTEAALHVQIQAHEVECNKLRQHVARAGAEAVRWMDACSDITRHADDARAKHEAHDTAMAATCAALQAVVLELQGVVAARDERIAQLAEALAEQQLVVDSRALVGGGKSIMGEIEALVHAREDSGVEDDHTAAFLTALLPRVAESARAPGPV